MSKLWIVAHDLHYPKWDRRTFHAMLAFIQHNKSKIDGFIFGGDQFDNETISHHTKGKLLYRITGGFKNDERGFERDVLTPLEADLPKNCTKVYIIGNHERFEHDFVEEHPELQGVLSHAENLRLVERGWEVIPLGHSYKLGALDVIHGEVLTGIGNQAGAFPSKKAIELYGGNVLAGHTHSPQSYTKVSPVNHRKKFQATIAPILGNTNPNYLRNRPTAWVPGFCIVELHEDKRNFNLYSVIVIDGKFSFAGTEYKA